MSKDLNPQIRNAFNKIICDSDFQELSSALNKTCLFEILTIERKEVIFTKVLSWLLDPSAEHDMKGQALKRFMHLCLSKYNDVDPELCRKMIDSFSIEDIDFDCVKVSAEKLTEVGRFDVYAELDQGSDQKDPKSQRAQPLLIIEAKIDALQSDGQTEKYKEWAEKNYIDKMPIMVYLFWSTPTGHFS